jgi:hypothetical protein
MAVGAIPFAKTRIKAASRFVNGELIVEHGSLKPSVLPG